MFRFQPWVGVSLAAPGGPPGGNVSGLTAALGLTVSWLAGPPPAASSMPLQAARRINGPAVNGRLTAGPGGGMLIGGA